MASGYFPLSRYDGKELIEIADQFEKWLAQWDTDLFYQNSDPADVVGDMDTYRALHKALRAMRKAVDDA
jgi:hypothetical protein